MKRRVGTMENTGVSGSHGLSYTRIKKGAVL